MHEGPPSTFVSADWVHTRPGGDFLLFEAGHGPQEAYRAGHIPGAVYLDTNAVERPPMWNRLPDGELARVLLAHGITQDKTVVLYGRGALAAARVGVILLYAGVRDVRLLDGGFSAWQAAGLPVETGECLPAPATTFGASVPARPEFFTSTEQVRAMLAGENSLVVSVRSWAEYIGETSGYGNIPARGRIAGAVWGHAGSDKDRLEDYFNPDGTARPLQDIAANWRKVGITPEKRVAFYCGTGWRASAAFFFAYAMGWKNISVYDGGWLEWSSDPANPTEAGIPHGEPNSRI